MELKPISVLTFFLLLELNFAQSPTDCPSHEMFVNCSSACEPTCQNQNSPQICILLCKEGCVCQKGFIREGPGGPCVPKPCKDEIKCTGNTTYSVCASDCPRVCNSTADVFCDSCSRGCECKDGFIRDQSGKCISEADCANCGKNQVYKKCGSNCPTCSTPMQLCSKRCFQGCFCPDGFLWDVKSQECVQKEQCPLTTCR